MPRASEIKSLVYTVKGRCRVCFTCVRECPAKAIKIINGQAEVISMRCIGCGTCTKVCSQGAKKYIYCTPQVISLLESDDITIAAVAPSFPADFDKVDYKTFIGMLRKLGFDYVTEVAFGADVVGKEYKKIFEDINASPCISANCPAIVHYIRQFHPELVTSLAPIISPMVAMTRIIHKKYGENAKVVFIGPCVAKKTESDEVDEVMTFQELREMFAKYGINGKNVKPSDFDQPVGGRGAIFPINRGMLQSVNISDNVLESNIIVAEGRINSHEAIKEFESGMVNAHLDLLACNGCIMGPGMSNNNKVYARQIKVSNYARYKARMFKGSEWERNMQKYGKIDLDRVHQSNDRRFIMPSKTKIDVALRAMGKNSVTDHLNCGACGYDSCIEHAIAINKGLAEVEMCLPCSISKLHLSIDELAVSNKKLVSVQQALKQSEKLASMGQLSAGIAHELNNPLGVVIMYANILLDECTDGEPLQEDLQLIVHQANRCKKIVRGLLNFARKNQVKFEEINIKKLTENSVESLIIPKNVELKIESLCKDPIAMLDVEQMTQVLNNLVKNGIEAIAEGGKISVKLYGNPQEVIFVISDTGLGIAKEHLDKIFEPFYTTKAIGKGTGLGLATTYGIVKMHNGKITVESNNIPSEGQTGTTFRIVIPRTKTQS